MSKSDEEILLSSIEKQGMCSISTFEAAIKGMRIMNVFLISFPILLKSEQAPMFDQTMYMLILFFHLLAEFVKSKLQKLLDKAKTNELIMKQEKCLSKIFQILAHFMIAYFLIFLFFMQKPHQLHSFIEILLLISIIFFVSLLNHHEFYIAVLWTVVEFIFHICADPSADSLTIYKLAVHYIFFLIFGYFIHKYYTAAYITGSNTYYQLGEFIQKIPCPIMLWNKEEGLIYANDIALKIFPEMTSQEEGFLYFANKMMIIKKVKGEEEEREKFATLIQKLLKFPASHEEFRREYGCEYCVKAKKSSSLSLDSLDTRYYLVTLSTPSFMYKNNASVVIIIRRINSISLNSTIHLSQHF